MAIIPQLWTFEGKADYIAYLEQTKDRAFKKRETFGPKTAAYNQLSGEIITLIQLIDMVKQSNMPEVF